MALYKRGEVWWFQFLYRGRRYQESTGTGSKTLAAEIQRKRRRAVEEAANGIKRTRNGAVLFSVAAAEWLKLMEPSWATKTHVNATIDVGHLKGRLGSSLLIDISTTAVSQYVTARRAQGAADKTTRNECGTLRGILKHYRLWAALQDDGVRLPRSRDAGTGMALTRDQEHPLLVACAASRSRSLLPAVTLALSTGLRLLEAGQSFAVVAEIMGWSAATAVRMAKRYGHIGDSVRRQAMAALESEPADDALLASATEASALLPQSSTIQ